MIAPARIHGAATLVSDEAARYARQVILPELGVEGQLRLKHARVLVVGAGGLGSPVLAYLGAAGVGTLGLVEFDTVDASNLHRQILFDQADIGRHKHETAARRLRAQNPNLRLELHPERLDIGNARDVVARYDIVVDTTDNFPTRYLVNDACVCLGKPLVSASILRFEGQLSMFWHGRGPCYRCVFPEPPPEGVAPSCADAGVVGAVPGVLGSLQAIEVIKWLVGAGTSMLGRLLVFDALSVSAHEHRVRPNPRCPICHPDAGDRDAAFLRLNAAGHPGACALVPQLDARQVLARPRPVRWVDVRNDDEVALSPVPGALHIPLPQLDARLAELPQDEPLVFVCQSGLRSQKAARLAIAAGLTDVANLDGGLSAWPGEVPLPR